MIRWKPFLCLYAIRLLHLVGVGVGSELPSSHAGHDVDVAAVVLHALLGASAGLLLLLTSLDLRGLALHLSGTSKRSVNFSHIVFILKGVEGRGGGGLAGGMEGI